MMIILYISIAFLGVIFIVTLINALTAPLVSHGPHPESTPLVSVLIPARNEAATLAQTLSTLIRQTYDPVEILVLDDHSTDDTALIVRNFAERDNRIRLLHGEALPQGWTGKNWACHQLSQQAKGDIYIFTDADNFYSPDAVEKTVGWMRKLNLTLFSAFPQQITETPAEKLVVPVFDTFVYSFLPLWLTYYAPFPSMAAANGQWLAMTREGYQRIGGHDAVRHHIVEDTELARLTKKQKERIITASGRGAVWGRMYSSWRQVYEGFSKNAFGLMGYNAVAFFILISLLFAMYILPYLMLPFQRFFLPAMAAILLGMSIRLIMAIKYKQPLLVSTLLNPVSIGATLIIAINSFKRYLKGSVTWKDRDIYFKTKS